MKNTLVIVLTAIFSIFSIGSKAQGVSCGVNTKLKTFIKGGVGTVIRADELTKINENGSISKGVKISGNFVTFLSFYDGISIGIEFGKKHTNLFFELDPVLIAMKTNWRFSFLMPIRLNNLHHKPEVQLMTGPAIQFKGGRIKALVGGRGSVKSLFEENVNSIKWSGELGLELNIGHGNVRARGGSKKVRFKSFGALVKL
jgi:hypothetical protein